MPGTEQEYGVIHIFGVRGTVTYLTVQDDDIEFTKGLDVEIKDSQGRVITNRLDDTRRNITVGGTLKDETDFADVIGGTFTYDSVSYIVKGVTDRGTNQDYRKVSIKGIKYQEIA